MSEVDWSAIAERFKRMYVPAVCDVLDEYGLSFQYVHHSIVPLSPEMKVAGPAFTIQGRSNPTKDPSKRLGPKVIDSFTPGVVAMYDTMRDEKTGVWGELWSAGAIRRGCVGAVVDGGIRDTAYIRRTGFPIFMKFTCPGDALGRFNIVDFQCRVNIGDVSVAPGDYVFGDEDGVVVIPADLTHEVLEKAERIVEKEAIIRREIETDQSLDDLYTKHKRF
jgi:4-hydroxy-4-methyl-2-oxoglutarate aldolase